MSKVLSSRAARAAAVAAASLAMAVGTTGQADAAIYWYSVQMVDQANQACLAAYPHVAYQRMASTISSCMYNGTDWISLVSEAPDESGHAVVQIQTSSPDYQSLCLSATTDNGPSQINGSIALMWDHCDPRNSWQFWVMSTAAPPQNVGNPAGLKHFINFLNLGRDVCLDGGIGAYGFPGSCSTTNNWQIWNIYTNAGSSPYT